MRVVLWAPPAFLMVRCSAPEAFKQILPDALSDENWFRFHGRYANGERIEGSR
jgi:hypothetical protein